MSPTNPPWSRVLILAAMFEEAVPYRESDQLRIVVTGIGAVNAAVTATRKIAEFAPDLVISTGSAGGLGAGLRIGDVVVGTEYRYHAADATAFGYALGQIPGMPEAFVGDATVLARAREFAALGDPFPATAPTPTQGDQCDDPRLHLGGMLSGDSFIAAPLVAQVRETFPAALSTDMESTAIAHTCHLAGVPFLSVRAISDLCDGSAADSFQLTLPEVAARAAEVVRVLID